MTLEALKQKATAGELVLIAEVERLVVAEARAKAKRDLVRALDVVGTPDRYGSSREWGERLSKAYDETAP